MSERENKLIENPIQTCPLCGGIYQSGVDCQGAFDYLLNLEFSRPDYGAVHFLTVACMMIQHQRYSDAGLVWLHEQLKAYLDGRISIEQIRKNNQRQVDSGNRSWSILRKGNDRPLPSITWSKTVQDIYGHFEDARKYCLLVENWATTISTEMQPWIESIETKS